MFGDIWEILGIEPTTEKKKIQQAYAEQLKQYHPEEHPEEFQRLQMAYRKASGYAKNKKVTVYEPNETLKEKALFERKASSSASFEYESLLVHNEPVESKDKKEEAIPDYIIGLKNVRIEKLYKEYIDDYAIALKEKLIGHKSKKDLKAIEDMFHDSRFCTILGMKAFQVRFREVMDYYEVWNQKALAVLLVKMQQLINDNAGANSNLTDMKQYLGFRVKKKKKVGMIPVVCACVSLVACILFISLMVRQTDDYALKNSPSKEEICQQVYETYEVIIFPEQITNIYVQKGYMKETGDIRWVKYLISCEVNGRVYDFEGKYLLGKKSDTIFNLEGVCLKNYAGEYLEDTHDFSNTFDYVYTINIRPEISGADEKERFMERITNMLDSYFADPLLKERDYEFTLKMIVKGTSELVSISINKDNYIEECKNLSAKLNEIIGNMNQEKDSEDEYMNDEMEEMIKRALITKFYKEGLYSEEEYHEKIQELESREKK